MKSGRDAPAASVTGPPILEPHAECPRRTDAAAKRARRRRFPDEPAQRTDETGRPLARLDRIAAARIERRREPVRRRNCSRSIGQPPPETGATDSDARTARTNAPRRDGSVPSRPSRNRPSRSHPNRGSPESVSPENGRVALANAPPRERSCRGGKRGEHPDFDPVKERTVPISSARPKPDLAIVASGCLNGYLEPCGCAGMDRMKGGLKRRYSFMDSLRTKRGVEHNRSRRGRNSKTVRSPGRLQVQNGV